MKMDLASVLTLCGGVGLFLYGMSFLGKSLEKLAGAGMERTLSKLTGNKYKSLALGTGVTCIIQSSAATSVMAIGFLNAGLFKLVQSVPVIMGANIGTTITAQILRLGDITGGNVLLTLLKPASFAPLCILIGAAIMLVSKRVKTHNIAAIVIGFGVLFFGLTTMESALSPLRESAAFRQMMTAFSDPILGILIGVLVTSIIQSSSASVGMLQALASTGAITWGTAIPIVLGMNVGKVFTVMIASIGTNRDCKRAVAIDIFNNVLGVIVCLGIYAVAQMFGGFSFWGDVVNRGNIADFHTLFNVGVVALVFPFCGGLCALSRGVIPDAPKSEQEQNLAQLDELFLKTPALALGRCKTVMRAMIDAAGENLRLACGLHSFYDEKIYDKMETNEAFLDRCETALGEYVMKILAQDLDPESHGHASELVYSIGDFERVGDYAVNIAEVARYNHEQELVFSEQCMQELFYITEAVQQTLATTAQAYNADDVVLARQVEPLEQTVDELVELLKSRHVTRMEAGLCDMKRGISFVEILTNLERVSDHCSNVAVRILQKIHPSGQFDGHQYLKQIHQGIDPEFNELRELDRAQYYLPLLDGQTETA